MMAKMFYTMEEARATLGRTEEEIKQFAREGRLREFRDGPRLMFKADQVEQLKTELGAGTDQVDLGVSDSGGLIGLVDTTGASGTSITLTEGDTSLPSGSKPLWSSSARTTSSTKSGMPSVFSMISRRSSGASVRPAARLSISVWLCERLRRFSVSVVA